MKRWRTLIVVSCGTVLLSASATSAQAVQPRPSATYRGKITEKAGSKVLARQRIFFVVDRQGRSVSDFTLRDGYPVYCAPKGIGEAQSTTAKVSRTGKFKARMPIYAKHHQRQGSLIVTGTFAAHNAESGQVKTLFTAASRQSCNGTARYQTQVDPKTTSG